MKATRLIVCLGVLTLWAHVAVAQSGPVFTQGLSKSKKFYRGIRFTHIYRAQDAEDGQLDCKLESSLEEASLTEVDPPSEEGEIVCTFLWIPNEYGPQEIVVVVVNRETKKSTKDRVTVTDPFYNESLRFTKDQPNVTLEAGTLWKFSYRAQDSNLVDGDVLTYQLKDEPAGAQINRQTGDFTWQTPRTASGEKTFKVEVIDKTGARAVTHTTVLFKEPDPPRPIFASNLPALNKIQVDQPFALSFGVSDSEDAGFSYELRQGPEGADFNGQTGRFTWTPAPNQAGRTHPVVVVGHDQRGHEETEEVLIEVSPQPDLQFSEIFDTKKIKVGELFSYTFQVDNSSARAGSSPRYHLIDEPDGADIGSRSGVFLWTPDDKQIREHRFKVRVLDAGRSVEREVVLIVGAVRATPNTPPSFTRIMPPVVVDVGDTLRFIYQAEDKDEGDSLTFSLGEGPPTVELDSTGVFFWIPGTNEDGRHEIVVVVEDRAGKKARTTTTLVVRPFDSGSTSTGLSLPVPWWNYLGGGCLMLGLILGGVYLVRTWQPSPPLLPSSLPLPPSPLPPSPLPPVVTMSERVNEVVFGKHRLVLGNAQHIGRRKEQQDAFGFSNPEDDAFVAAHGLLAVVADGIGGMELGREASQAAVKAFLDAYERESPRRTIARALYRTMFWANEAVLSLAIDEDLEDRVGTTLSAAAVHHNHLFWISAGDTRIYLYRDGDLQQLSSDHYYANHLAQEVERGNMDEFEAFNHPKRSALTSYLGLYELHEVDWRARPFLLQPGDRIVQCSDGLYGSLTGQEIIQNIKDDPQATCDTLVEQAIAKQYETQDNITVVIMAYE